MTVLWLLSIFGFAVVVGYGQITLNFRLWVASLGSVGIWLKQLMECSMCLSWWAGALLGKFVWSPTTEIWPACSWLLDGFLAAGSSLILYSILSVLTNAAALLERRMNTFEGTMMGPSGGLEGPPRASDSEEQKHG
ncbi:MAG: hypothetical protein ACREH5_03205 [Candidatus Omnitrophota bacterium]